MYKEILVVNDQPRSRNSINKGLETAGYNSILAQNEAEALVALWERQEHIGLVLLDVHLPVINGLNILKIIRKHFPDKKIIITGEFQKNDLVDDADDYHDKSEDLINLIEKINNVLTRNLYFSNKI